jgi:glutaredoxin
MTPYHSNHELCHHADDATPLKAGQRETPMLFIDDEFAGNYDKIMELNEYGELDAIFDY